MVIGSGQTGAAEDQLALPINGPWVGLSLAARPQGAFTAYLNGTWLLPTTADTPVQVTGPDDSLSSAQWYTVEGALNYWGLYSGLGLVGGFRYESFDSSMGLSWGGSPAPGFAVLNEEDADLAVDLYIPYVGLVADYRGAQIGVLGFPLLLGDMKFGSTVVQQFLAPIQAAGWNHGEWNPSFDKGYFFELFFQWKTALDYAGAPGNFGLFAKYSQLWGSASTDSSDTWVNPGAQGALSLPIDVTFRRQTYALGVNAEIAFSLPWLSR
jgi:hypothetical protein